MLFVLAELLHEEGAGSGAGYAVRQQGVPVVFTAGSKHELRSASAPETKRHKINHRFTSLYQATSVDIGRCQDRSPAVGADAAETCVCAAKQGAL